MIHGVHRSVTAGLVRSVRLLPFDKALGSRGNECDEMRVR
jgi:hypothetical protein